MLLETLPSRIDELSTRVTSAGFEAGKLVEPLVIAGITAEAERYYQAEAEKAPEGTARAAALSYLMGLIRTAGRSRLGRSRSTGRRRKGIAMPPRRRTRPS